MNFSEVQIKLDGQPAWYWKVSFTDQFGCVRELQSPIRWNPGIPPDIQADMEAKVRALATPPPYIFGRN